jgi:HSP20 family protein
MMNMMRRFDPFDDMLSLRDAMQQLMEDAVVIRGRSSSSGSVGMPLDLHETQDSFVVEAVLPGVQPNDVDIADICSTGGRIRCWRQRQR